MPHHEPMRKLNEHRADRCFKLRAAEQVLRSYRKWYWTAAANMIRAWRRHILMDSYPEA